MQKPVCEKDRGSNKKAPWLPQFDRMLIAGIKHGPAVKREVTNKIIRLAPQWTRGDCWKRIRHLRKLPELTGLKEQQYGEPNISRPTHRSSCGPWTPADDDTLLNLAGYEPVTRIAQRLSRSVSAVRFRLGSLGMSAKVTDGWSLRALQEMLHIRASRLRGFIGNGLLRVRDARITASSLAACCHKKRLSSVPSNVQTVTSALAKDCAAFTWERAADALGVELIDLQRLISAGQLKLVDTFVTDRAFEEFCRKHGDQINMALIDPATARWLIREYGISQSAGSVKSVSRWQKHSVVVRDCKCGRKIAGNVYFKHIKRCSPAADEQGRTIV